jgi:hypothetical protein
MAFCTAEQVRACNVKLESEKDAPDTMIESRIAEADDTLTVDLSSMYSASELVAFGSDNKMLNLLSRWKAAELLLAQLYGATRNVDEVSDVDYWRKKYDSLIKRILNNEVMVSEGVTADNPVNKPVITETAYRKKLFPRKGLADFEEGEIDDRL